MAEAQAKFAGTAGAYERYMGRWSRKVAPLFVEWLAPARGKSWADIGCGTGALSAAIASHSDPARIVGFDLSADYVAEAGRSVPQAEFRQADATATGLAAHDLDYAVSGLFLNFVPDKSRALKEMVRIVRPGGTVALYVWDYAGQMQIMRYFFDCARLIDARSAEFDDGVQAPICRPEPLREAFKTAGLSAIDATAIDVPAAFTDFDDYWTPFLGGTGSAPKYCAALDQNRRNKIKDAVRAKLPTGPDGEILLAVRAWAVKGKVR